MKTKVVTWHVSVVQSSNCRTPSSTTTSQSTRHSTNSRRRASRPHPPRSPLSQLVRLARPRSPTRLSCVTTYRLVGSARRRITTCTPDSLVLTRRSLPPPSPAHPCIPRYLEAPAATLLQQPSHQPLITVSHPAPKSNRKCFIRTHARQA